MIHYFKRKFTEKYNLKAIEINPEVENHLFWYHWPGNVRELSNLIERLLVVTPKKHIKLNDLPEPYCNYFPYKLKEKFTIHEIAPLKETVNEFKLELIHKALNQCRTQREAAKILGISFSNLSKILKKLNF